MERILNMVKVACVVIGLLFAGSAAAVTINFTGNTTFVDDPSNQFGTIGANDPQGFFTFSGPLTGVGVETFNTLTDASLTFGDNAVGTLGNPELLGGFFQAEYLNGVLQSFEFQASAIYGVIDINLIFGSGTGDGFGISLSAFGQDAYAEGTIAPVGAVPLPGAVWLFLSGLAGLIGIRRRRASGRLVRLHPLTA